MGVASGKFGFVNGESTIRNWSLSETMTTHAVYASNTKGAPRRKKGVSDWSGSFLQSVIAPTNMPGDTFNFVGHASPTSGVEGESGFAYSGPAIVESLAVNWDWSTGAPIGQTVNFAGNGALTKTAATGADATDPDVPCADSNTKIEIVDSDGGSGGSGDDELCGLTSATLNLLAANQAYTNACTGGWAKRIAGTIDWNLALNIQEADPSSLSFGRGDYVEIKAYVDIDSFWHLKWGIVRDFTNFVVDRDTGNIIGFTINVEMSTHDDTPTEGHIIAPDSGSNWWPIP